MSGVALFIIAPKGRQHLAAYALLRLVRSGFDSIPDHRCADAEMSFTDARMAACAMFALQSPVLLAFDKQRAEGNVGRLYGMERVPCATQRRERLDLQPSKTTICTLFLGSKQVTMPLCSRRCRRRSTPDVSPMPSGMPEPWVLGLGFAWSMTCRSRHRTPLCGSMASRTGQEALTIGSPVVWL